MGLLCLLVDPVELSLLPGVELLRLEPKGDLLLGGVDGVRAVADVAADIDGKVTTDGARGGGERVGSTEELAADLDDLLALPDHGADGARAHVGDKTGEEWLVGEVRVVLLEVLLAGGHELDGDELVATLLEASDDGTNKATLRTMSAIARSRMNNTQSNAQLLVERTVLRVKTYLDTIRLDGNEAVHLSVCAPHLTLQHILTSARKSCWLLVLLYGRCGRR